MCLPVGKGLDISQLPLVDGLVALNEGQVGLGGDMGGAPESKIKMNYNWLFSCHITKRRRVVDIVAYS